MAQYESFLLSCHAKGFTNPGNKCQMSPYPGLKAGLSPVLRYST